MTTADDFSPETILALLRQADRLESFPRSGYVLSRVPMPESVAAHAYGVCLVSMLLADAVKARTQSPSMDRGLLLEMAILHDLSEAMTTDIPWPVKRLMGRAEVKRAESEAARHMLSPLSGRYVEVVERYEKGQCLESRIVHAADKIQMMVKVLQYERAGLGDLDRFWSKDANFKDQGLPEARAILERLKRYRQEGDWPVSDFD
jgi:putative hydrolase of HD superfamily